MFIKFWTRNFLLFRPDRFREEILMEAFESMNLGSRPEDEESPQSPESAGLGRSAKPNTKLEESFGVEVSGKIRQMGAQVH